MVKIDIIAVGRDKDRWISDGSAHFEKLLSKFAQIKWIPVAAEKGSSLSPALTRKAEGERIAARLGKGLVVALHDKGLKCDSPQLAKKLESWLASCSGRITFLIGGAYGLSEQVLAKADIQLSLSRMTFSHQIVRIVLMEQLYRAFSILHGSDYHK